MTDISGGYSVDVVVPCFNEHDALPLTVKDLLAYFRALGSKNLKISSFRILLVDDGSQDDTWALIEAFSANEPEVQGIKLARNYGHQSALMCGLENADADAVLSIDADLQDDLETVGTMLRAFEGGADLALGVREDRASDSLPKRWTAETYYRGLSALGAPVVRNHADFRLMSRRAVDALLAYPEANLFLRGIVGTLGFNVSLIPYARKTRNAGETKYSLRKMIELAVNGITSFSTTPLRFVAAMGVVILLLSTLASLWVLAARVVAPSSLTPGWASTLLPIFVLGGLQLFSMGIIGEYVGKVYLEVKRRPRFFVADRTAGVANTSAEQERS